MRSESDRPVGPCSKAPLQHVELPQERIMQAIHLVRGHKGLLDADLAILCEVETKALTLGTATTNTRATATKGAASLLPPSSSPLLIPYPLAVLDCVARRAPVDFMDDSATAQQKGHPSV